MIYAWLYGQVISQFRDEASVNGLDVLDKLIKKECNIPQRPLCFVPGLNAPIVDLLAGAYTNEIPY
ncbi:hypothetical protein [Rosenbergiella australiborealis]|uniref:hypothetical protein n=1 Tax=Rosenbergiella australiborealis TaxID=1544696 RepID=UPI001BDA19D5|nr:hypothetical protein [Rosenbergiella australiborealis]